MDRLDAMKAFVRIVERRSFTQAAEDLGIPRSTATDAVKGLEARFGVRLLQRTTRTVCPTLDGEAYYQRCLAILAEVEEAEGAFAGANLQGILRIDVHGSLARHFILPNIADFMDRHPGLEICMSEGDRLVDLVREGIDCVVRVGHPQDSGELIITTMARLDCVTVAAPCYLERRTEPNSLSDLAKGHWMVGFRSSAQGGGFPLEFMVKGEVQAVFLPTRLSVDGAESYVAAAQHGMGIIQVPRYHVEQAIGSGVLRPILTDTPPPGMPVSVLYPRHRHLSGRVRVFIDWLRGAFQP